jgi:hypothetical protein
MYPYQRIAHILSIVLLLAVAYLVVYPTGLPGWVLTTGWVLAGALFAAWGMELWQLIRQFRAGQLFLVRNLTFYVTLATLILIPTVLVGSGTGGFGPATWLLLPIILFQGTRNLGRVVIDRVAILFKLGAAPGISVPRFQVEAVSAQADQLIVTTPAREITLPRRYFYPAQWQRLREELQSMG